jgi:hypothetical protein
MDSNSWIYTVPNNYILIYEEAIAKWKGAGIIYSSNSHNPINMFPKLKPDGKVWLLTDLVSHNKTLVEDNGLIYN